jgi:TIGR03009 family protein
MQRHSTIRTSLLAVVCASYAPVAFGQAPEATGSANAVRAKSSAPADSAKMERVLELWAKECSRLETLDAQIFRRDFVVDWEEYGYFEGRVLFKKPNEAHIEFRKIEQDQFKKPIKAPQSNAWVSTLTERQIFNGQEVRLYDFAAKQVVVRPLDKHQASQALGWFPLSIFFNIRADDARNRFTMTLIGEDDKTYSVALKPKTRLDRESFSQAYIQLDRELMLPIRIVLHSPDGKSQKDFQLSAVQRNAKIDPRMFEGETDPSWKEVGFGWAALVGFSGLW